MIDLDTSLHYHLRNNHFPPVSDAFIDTAKQAIELANQGDYDTEIEMPNGITLEVNRIIEGLHLEFYLDDEGDE
jgi:hypothetical protein